MTFNSIKALCVKRREQIAYLFAGGATTAVNHGVYAVLAYGVGMLPDPVNIISVVLSILFAYPVNRIFVFRSSAKGIAAAKEFCSFVAGRALTLLLEIVSVHLFFTYISQNSGHNQLFKLGVNVLVVVLNYVLSKLWAFRKK